MKKPDPAFREALKKAYTARAKLFFEKIQQSKVGSLLEKVQAIDGSSIKWDLELLGIQESSFHKVRQAEVPLHYVFSHPEILSKSPELLDYYRNLTALSKKGLAQLFSGQKLSGGEKVLAQARALNKILSVSLEAFPSLSMDLIRDVICAEIGTEIQGTWANRIGRGAAKLVESMLESFAREKGLIKKIVKEKVEISGKQKTRRSIVLKNDWRIVFSPEPDVGVYDPNGTIRVAIEIKGSMDKAGAQTRYGEAKKSFGKALQDNPKCETIYLASVFTDAVSQQIQANGQVRKPFNLVDILSDEKERAAFLDEIFRYQIRLEY